MAYPVARSVDVEWSARSTRAVDNKSLDASGVSGLVIDNLSVMQLTAAASTPRYMASDEQRKARAIQESIRQILLRDWDPIGVNDVPEAQDEYDSYVGGVYRLLASHCSTDQMVNHLAKIESQTMELGVANREHLTRVANQLLALNVSL